MATIQDSRYVVPCPFCAIANSYPATNVSIPESPFIPTNGLHSSTQLILSTPTILAFLDTYPLVPGHILVIPREHHDRLTSLPARTAATLGAWLPVIARAVVKATGATAFNVVGNNGSAAAQTVDHVHWHIIPRGVAWESVLGPEDPKSTSARESESMQKMRAKLEERGQGKTWIMFGRGQRREIDEDEAELIGAKVRKALLEEVPVGGLWSLERMLKEKL